MSIVEMFEMYMLQDKKSYGSMHEDSGTDGGHLDCGPGHMDYPHADHHTDEF